MVISSDANPLKPIPGSARKCPICGKPAGPRHQPFCSTRCADIDLGRWLKGTYSVPSDEAPEDEPREDES
jgi:uncharacterized protein